MRKKPTLRLVPYSPNDYSLASVLMKEDHEIISSPDTISAAMSLLFQFPDYSFSFLLQTDGLPVIPIELNYDREDIELTEIHIRTPKDQGAVPKNVIQTHVFIRFEIFHHCYEFRTQVLDHSVDDLLIIAVPTTLTVFKPRRLPRVRVHTSPNNYLPDFVMSDLSGTRPTNVALLEIGVTAVKLQFLNEAVINEGFLRFEKQQIFIKLIRQIDSERAIYSLIAKDNKEYGAIFDLYRRIAYPQLRPRDTFTPNEILDLYSEKTRYFDKFQTLAHLDERKASLRETWLGLTNEQHHITADYVTVDDSGRPAGASSVALAFWKKDKPVWVFHQLCARTSPELLHQSGILYIWRAEYLAGRSEDFDLVFWFDSRSRWLERIYVKFAIHKSKAVSLSPASVIKRDFSSTATEASVPSKKESYGEFTRYFAHSEMAFGAANPPYLNASGILESVVAVSKESTNEDIQGVANALMAEGGISKLSLEVTVPLERKEIFTTPESVLVSDVDRFCAFDKSALIDFIASVEHSMAVTERKGILGETNATA